MLKIEYEIKLNESGRPYIHLPENYDNKPEHKFFALEITRYVLQNIEQKRKFEFDDENKILSDCTTMLGQVGDETAKLLYDDMKEAGYKSLLINKNYHIMVSDISELNNYNNNEYIYNEVIYERKEGLKAYVVNEDNLYMFDGENWNIV